MAEAQQTPRDADDYSWIVPIEVMLGSINHKEVQACSISSVADKLRNPKVEAYRPQVLSIGPLHKEIRSNLQLMEELKWRYTLSLLERTGQPQVHTQRLRHSAAAMLDLDNVVRASYGGTIKFEPHDLAKILLVDGCFVLEFLFRLQKYKEEHRVQENNFVDPIFENEVKLFPVLNDLTMFEN